LQLQFKQPGLFFLPGNRKNKTMNKIIICLLTLSLVTACKTKPYLEHKANIKIVANKCEGMDETVKMNSNINGERYEFYKCLNANFDESSLFIERRGDTISVKITTMPDNRALFKIILDIDTYPRYNFLEIDGNVMPVIPASL